MTRAEMGAAAVVGVLGALVLLSMSVPMFGTISRKAKLNKSLQHAKQIALVLRVYAEDHEGRYPTGANANECFAPLVAEIETEKIFYVPKSAWHGTGKFLRGPDNLWEESTPPGTALAPGENCYAFNRAAKPDSRKNMPIIATGFSEKIGVYSNRVGDFGGVWAEEKRGNSSVVIFADGAGETRLLDENLRVTEGGRNIFLGIDCDFVNPARP